MGALCCDMPSPPCTRLGSLLPTPNIGWCMDSSILHAVKADKWVAGGVCAFIVSTAAPHPPWKEITPAVGTVFIASVVASRPGWSTHPPVRKGFGGRDEYGPIGVKLIMDELTMRSVRTCLRSRVSNGIADDGSPRHPCWCLAPQPARRCACQAGTSFTSSMLNLTPMGPSSARPIGVKLRKDELIAVSGAARKGRISR
jgi:hypothetical protein